MGPSTPSSSSSFEPAVVRQPPLKELLENAAVGLHWVGPDGTILWANKTELELLGYTSEEYIGRHIAEFHVDRSVIDDILDRLNRNETLHNYEARLRCKDGSIKHVLISSNVRWEDGKFCHTQCFTQDVTARKAVEDALRDSEARYRILFEHNPLPAWVFDLDTLAILAVNEAAVRHYGYSREEFVQMKVNAIRLEEDTAGVHGLISSQFSAEKGMARHRRKDGSIINVEVIASDIPFGGRPARMVIANDVTERKQAEQRLALYQRIVTSSNDGIAIIGPDSRYLEQNAAHRELTGYSDEDLQHATPAIHLGEEAFQQIVKELSETGRYRGEAVSRRKNGDIIYVDLSAFSMVDESGQVVCYVGIKRDITERKRHEAEVRQRLNELEAIYRLTNTIGRLDGMSEIYEEALESIRLGLQTDGSGILLFDGNVLRFKAWRGLSSAFRQRMEQYPGWSPWDKEALWAADIATVEQEDSRLQALSAAAREDGLRGIAMVPLQVHGRVQGQVCLTFRSVHPFSDEVKRLIQSIAGHIALAIERTRVEEEVRRLNAQLVERSRAAENLIKYAPDPVFVVDLQGKILQANDAVADLLGVRPDEVLEQSLARFISAAEVQELMQALRQVVERGVSRNAKLHPRNVHGEVIPTTLNASALRDSNGWVVGAIGILRDMRAYERILRDLEKSRAELQEKILDLQKFEEVVVGRELKMIELENELQRLRSQHA